MYDYLIEKIKQEHQETAFTRFIDMTVFGLGVGFLFGTVLTVAVKLLE